MSECIECCLSWMHWDWVSVLNALVVRQTKSKTWITFDKLKLMKPRFVGGPSTVCIFLISTSQKIHTSQKLEGEKSTPLCRKKVDPLPWAEGACHAHLWLQLIYLLYSRYSLVLNTSHGTLIQDSLNFPTNSFIQTWSWCKKCAMSTIAPWS